MDIFLNSIKMPSILNLIKAKSLNGSICISLAFLQTASSIIESVNFIIGPSKFFLYFLHRI
ncbi:hypothetical protein CFSAN002367_18198 [Clostridium botulinum CFSAN002367]|nr:hypothetical protein CFSAN002367_18198 [Clostridium botulinum CFSAN002367]